MIKHPLPFTQQCQVINKNLRTKKTLMLMHFKVLELVWDITSDTLALSILVLRRHINCVASNTLLTCIMVWLVPVS